MEQEDTLSKFNVILNQCKQLLTCESDRAPIGTGKREWWASPKSKGFASLSGVATCQTAMLLLYINKYKDKTKVFSHSQPTISDALPPH